MQEGLRVLRIKYGKGIMCYESYVSSLPTGPHCTDGTLMQSVVAHTSTYMDAQVSPFPVAGALSTAFLSPVHLSPGEPSCRGS